MLDAGEAVAIVDLRSAGDVEAEPFSIPGAFRVDAAEIASAHGAIPRDREIVLYCT
jgi:rhodanese-related sulfurtransferase